MALSQSDFKTAADKLGVEVAAVRAIAAVESSGSGFFKDGRPVILFERHIFLRELTAKKQRIATAEAAKNAPNAGPSSPERIMALRSVKIYVDGVAMNNPDICNTATGGYVGGPKEYERLAKAKTIDEECALRSCSWGAFQVMGFHAENLGFANVNEFLKACETEVGQLDIFVRFILKNPPILKALRAKNWVDVARYYNGPAYEKNQYDKKLAAAYSKYVANPSIA